MGCVYSRSCIGEICATASIRESHTVTSNRVKAGDSSLPVFSPTATSNSDDEAENGDRISQLGDSVAAELGISRLSRVSSQFLPADGSRTVKVPSANFELKCSFLSQRGYYPDQLDKANQDSFCIHTPCGSNPDDHFFGVFDGHGENGAQCSQFVKKKLCENLLRNSKFQLDAVEACHAAFLVTNSQLHADILDDSMSGTTAITVLVRGRTIYVANSGDSRAVIGEKRGNDIVAVDLSIDQTPFRVDELERVKLCGARVMTLDQIDGLKDPDEQCWGTEEGDDGDPPRLWLPNGMYPGTAFTRSIGDSVAETIGVVANPEIVVLELNQDHPFFVLASDGVFEFLTSQTVVDMVAKYKDPQEACAAIVAESYRQWLQYETRTDDITVIVIHINGLTAPAIGQITCGSAVTVLRPNVPQIVELTGSESPSTFGWNAKNQRTISRSRLHAIESSRENGQSWVPPSPAHRKTWEEEAHIESALHDHFLFRKLTNSQCHVLLDCMQRVEVQPGDIVVKQGGEGDCFYVVGSGEFEVLATQEENNGAVTKVFQMYTAEKLSSFGELALMSNKPLQASVHAVTSGTLWALKREDFRGILMSEFSNLSSLKMLRSVDFLAKLSILQLSHIADSLYEVSFSDGQTIVDKNEVLSALYIIQKGQAKITFDTELLDCSNVCSLKSNDQRGDDNSQSSNMLKVEKTEGSYFGEWVLLGEQLGSLSAVAVGNVVCAVLTKEKFDSVVGPLPKLLQDLYKSRDNSIDFSKNGTKSVDISTLAKVSLSDMEWKTCLYSTECCEIGLVQLKDSENLVSLKRFSKQKVKKLGKETQVLRENKLMKTINPSAFVPQVICTCADRAYAGILLNTLLACPMASILQTPFEETSARFCAASIVAALEYLHESGVLYRGVSPDVLMFDQASHIQLVDFRFGKKIFGERTFTMSGMTDSLAPEIVEERGHGFSSDWWALGVLLYFMLQGEMPFGSRSEHELDTFANIAKGQYTPPRNLSPEAVDLIGKLLEVDETSRLGSQGPDSVKNHPWFSVVDWKQIKDGSFPVPHEITSRISQYLENHSDDRINPQASPIREVDELDVSECLDDW